MAATDTNNNVRTNNYQVTVSSGANRTLSYDLDGNLINDAIKTYEWDAGNRLLAINYTGTSNRTEFTYDGLGRRAKIVEKTGTTINSAKTFVWDGLTLAEERNNSNKVTRKHYPEGVQFLSYNPNTTTPYFYFRDHIGSIREMTDGTGTIKARYDYDPWGNRTKLSGNLDADFGYTGHYYHVPSNLHLAPYRGYDSTLGRWLSRDPIDEEGGPNLYGYVGNNPAIGFDPFGLFSWSGLGQGVEKGVVGLGVGLAVGGAIVLAAPAWVPALAIAGSAYGGFALGQTLYEAGTGREWSWEGNGRMLCDEDRSSRVGQGLVGIAALGLFSSPWGRAGSATDDAFMAMTPRQRLSYEYDLMTVSPAIRSATKNIPIGQRGLGPFDMAPSQWRNTVGTGLTPLGRLSSGAGIAGSQHDKVPPQF